MSSIANATIAIEQLYRDYRLPILRYLERLVSSREMAEDLCQETFIKALRGWEQHDPTASARSWLYRIATNTAYDELRRRRRTPSTSLNDTKEEPLASSSFAPSLDERDTIQDALRQLPARYRMPLLLHIYGGYPLEVIAATLGWKLGTVKSRMHRAREQFRQHYRGDAPLLA